MTVNVSIKGLNPTFELLFVKHVFAMSNVLPEEAGVTIKEGTNLDRFMVDPLGHLHVRIAKNAPLIPVIKILRGHLIDPNTGNIGVGLAEAKNIANLREFILPFADLSNWMDVRDKLQKLGIEVATIHNIHNESTTKESQ